LGQNPPAGALIDYWLKDDIQGPVTLNIKDSTGNVIEQFSSQEEEKKLPANRYFEKEWVGKSHQLSTKSGTHRFIWDLRYPRPSALEYHYSIAAVWRDGTPILPRGPLVMPGKYTVTLNVNGKPYSRPLIIKMDPRVKVGNNDLAHQLQFALQVDALLNKSVALYNKIGRLEDKTNLSTATKKALSDILRTGQPHLSSIISGLTSLATSVQRADAAPVQGETDVFNHYKNQADQLIKKWDSIKEK
jgi:hypothetical protein